MKRIKNRVLIFTGYCLVILLHFSVQSQNSNGFEAAYYAGEPLEKIVLQTDRDLYLAGEYIWFSSFCSIINESAFSPISQILYIEIYNAERKVFLREKFKLNEGKTAGYLVIPEETPTDYYFIRAYTMYLRNFSPENYFTSSLTIVNPEIPQSGSIFNQEIKTAIEIGNLSSDIPSKIALKLPPGILQKTTDVFLVNNMGEQTNELNIYPNGLCLAEYIAVDSLNYFIKLQFQNGDSLYTPLVPKDVNDLVIHTQMSGTALDIKVLWPAYDQKHASDFKLKITSQAYFDLFETDLILNNKTNIPFSKLSQGMNHIVVVDQKDSIVGFKSVYFENEIPGNIELKLQKSNFNTREKVELDVQLSEQQSEYPELVTVSVIKKGTTVSNELFLPEVVIENPFLMKSYFQKNTTRTAEIKEQINIALMLFDAKAKEAYRNFLNRPKSDWIYPPEIRDISISGLLVDKNSREPLKDVQMFVSVLFEDFQLHTTKTKDDGSFVFALNHLTGNHNLYLFPDLQDDGEHELLIHNDFSTDFRALNKCTPIIDTSLIHLLEEIYVNQQVSNKFPGGITEKQHKVRELSSWFGVEMISINLADYINLTSFREVINEIVPSVRLRENNNQYRFTVFDDKAELTYENPLVLLDNIPVTDINELIKIHPAMIEKIEVMNHPYVLGDYTIWGLILITTKTDNFAGVKLPEESAFLNYQTQTNSASFVPLQFGAELNENSSNPFFHTTLYWNPYFNSNQDVEKISFYTSDNASEFDLIVRGIKSDGSPYLGSATFTVTK